MKNKITTIIGETLLFLGIGLLILLAIIGILGILFLLVFFIVLWPVYAIFGIGSYTAIGVWLVLFWIFGSWH